MNRHGQYCPVARASELLGQRWMILVIRELLWGSDRFTAIARGVPRMSPSLLASRLRELERVGLVVRDISSGEPRYRLTPAGYELMPVIEQIGVWGQRWIQEVRDDEYDPTVLMLDIAREVNADTARRAPATAVVRIDFNGFSGREGSWWWLFSPAGIDVCDIDPGSTIDAWLRTDPATLTRLWLGELSWAAATDETVVLHGDATTVRGLPRWLGVSRFASVERGPTTLGRL